MAKYKEKLDSTRMDVQKLLALCGGRRGKVVAAVLMVVFLTMLLFGSESNPSSSASSSSSSSSSSSTSRIMRLTEPSKQQSSSSSSSSSSGIAFFDPKKFDQKIHLVIPVTSPTELYCKVLFSALVNEYPPPQLINYNGTFKNAAIARAQKIKGFRDYLVDKAGDKDIVILVDGFDAWFQLPLPVLLSRFLKLRTPVIFGADKKCWPNEPDSDACTVVPSSPLAKDLYGPDTDKLTILRDHKTKYDNFRPRWVNSGTIIGYGKEVRELYVSALEKINGTEVNSDQMIIAEVYADRILSGRTDMFADFRSNLFQTMTYSHNDVAFIRSPSSRIKATAFTAHQPKDKLDLEGLGIPDDASGSGVKVDSPWFYRNLAWNRFTNTIPAVLHFNGPKEFLTNWWPLMWWYETGPEILEELRAPANKWKAGSKVDDGWLSWDAACGSHDLFAKKG